MNELDPGRASQTWALGGLALPHIIGSFAGQYW
jgi:hypothetical protein